MSGARSESETKTESPIFAAIQKNDADEVMSLVQQGAGLTSVNSINQTPIEFAATLEYWPIVSQIAGYNSTDKDDAARYSAVLLAALLANQSTVANTLIEAGAQPTRFNILSKDNCFHLAVINKHLPVVNNLLNCDKKLIKANLKLNNIQKMTPIELAGESQFWDAVQLFVEKSPAANQDEAQLQHYDKTLLRAINKANYAIIKLLLGHHAACDAWDTERGNIALYQAVETKRVDIVELILNASTDASHYEPALQLAVRNKDAAIVKLLLEHHAPCNSWNSKKGNIALYDAIDLDNTVIVQLLLAAGADPAIKNQDGLDSLEIATSLNQKNSADAIKAFISKKPLSKHIATPGLLDLNKAYQHLTDNAFTVDSLIDTVSDHKERAIKLLNQTVVSLNYLRGKTANDNKKSRELTSFISLVNSLQKNISNDLLTSLSNDEVMLLASSDFQEAKEIKELIQQMGNIFTFADTIKSDLVAIKAQIDINEWLIKNPNPLARLNFFSGNIPQWIQGMPKMLSQISMALEQLSRVTSSEIENIFQVYATVYKILSGISFTNVLRHDDTANFYKNALTMLNTIRFKEAAPIAIDETVEEKYSSQYSSEEKREPTPSEPPPSYADTMQMHWESMHSESSPSRAGAAQKPVTTFTSFGYPVLNDAGAAGELVPVYTSSNPLNQASDSAASPSPSASNLPFSTVASSATSSPAKIETLDPLPTGNTIAGPGLDTLLRSAPDVRGLPLPRAPGQSGMFGAGNADLSTADSRDETRQRVAEYNS